jgi:hypothetical protein
MGKSSKLTPKQVSRVLTSRSGLSLNHSAARLAAIAHHYRNSGHAWPETAAKSICCGRGARHGRTVLPCIAVDAIKSANRAKVRQLLANCQGASTAGHCLSPMPNLTRFQTTSMQGAPAFLDTLRAHPRSQAKTGTRWHTHTHTHTHITHNCSNTHGAQCCCNRCQEHTTFRRRKSWYNGGAQVLLKAVPTLAGSHLRLAVQSLGNFNYTRRANMPRARRRNKHDDNAKTNAALCRPAPPAHKPSQVSKPTQLSLRQTRPEERRLHPSFHLRTLHLHAALCCACRHGAKPNVPVAAPAGSTPAAGRIQNASSTLMCGHRQPRVARTKWPSLSHSSRPSETRTAWASIWQSHLNALCTTSTAHQPSWSTSAAVTEFDPRRSTPTTALASRSGAH